MRGGKGKGKARRPKREKGKLPRPKTKREKSNPQNVRSNSTRQPDRAYARMNETKRFPVPPNLRFWGLPLSSVPFFLVLSLGRLLNGKPQHGIYSWQRMGIFFDREPGPRRGLKIPTKTKTHLRTKIRLPRNTGRIKIGRKSTSRTHVVYFEHFSHRPEKYKFRNVELFFLSRPTAALAAVHLVVLLVSCLHKEIQRLL